MPDINFQEWVKGRFDKPEGPEPWYYDYKNDPPEPSPALSLQYLRKLFSESGEVLKGYSNRQLKDGLWYLFDPSNSNELFCLLDETLPLKERLETVDAIYLLYRECFFKRCSKELSHLSKVSGNPLNSICYMVWDVAAFRVSGGKTEKPEVDAACLAVMEKALALDHDACRESALHGLGHTKWYYPAEVQRIIGAFLKTGKNISPDLRKYAEAACTGMIQ
ncbi:MAG: hypothetical protein AB7V08_02480 [Elusimicrobiales bacterium]